jgi:hypothetical protein
MFYCESFGGVKVNSHKTQLHLLTSVPYYNYAFRTCNKQYLGLDSSLVEQDRLKVS